MMLMLFLVGFTACQEQTNPAEEISSEIHAVLIDIDVVRLLEVAAPGDEVPEVVQMFNGSVNHAAGEGGEANLITEVQAGDEIVWQLANAEGVTITDFEFFVLSGEDVLSLPGGEQPKPQADGSWKARISPMAKGKSVLKYNVHFEVNGKSYWWDPIVKLGNLD